MFRHFANVHIQAFLFLADVHTPTHTNRYLLLVWTYKLVKICSILAWIMPLLITIYKQLGNLIPVTNLVMPRTVTVFYTQSPRFESRPNLSASWYKAFNMNKTFPPKSANYYPVTQCVNHSGNQPAWNCFLFHLKACAMNAIFRTVFFLCGWDTKM